TSFSEHGTSVTASIVPMRMSSWSRTCLSTRLLSGANDFNSTAGLPRSRWHYTMVVLPFCIIPVVKVTSHVSEERVGLHNRLRAGKITTYTGSFRKEPPQPALRTTTAGRMCGANLPRMVHRPRTLCLHARAGRVSYG